MQIIINHANQIKTLPRIINRLPPHVMQASSILKQRKHGFA